jgi:regulation of enolase protein 1 (concanavalin A-like superfamily)
MQRVDWSEGAWTTEPELVARDGDVLRVRAKEGSDAWLRTAYGFVHDTEHALLAAFEVGTAMEVEFAADFSEQFDQAGLFVRADAERWMKAGVEFADRTLNVGAVVTDRMSDWSVGPVPEWTGRRVRVRVSRGADALTMRAAVDDEPYRLVRVAPFPGDAVAAAGPFVCAPTRAGLEVAFLRWTRGDADTTLH